MKGNDPHGGRGRVCKEIMDSCIKTRRNITIHCVVKTGSILHINFWHRSFTFNSNKSPTRCNNFSVYYPDVSLQLNMFPGVFPPIIRSSMTAVAASGFTFLSWWQSCCVRGRAGRPASPTTNTALPLQSLSSWWWAGKRPKHVELWTNVRIINWKIFASGWWFIWIVRWCTDLQTLNFTFKF
jgi:hypothetical protein